MSANPVNNNNASPIQQHSMESSSSSNSASSTSSTKSPLVEFFHLKKGNVPDQRSTLTTIDDLKSKITDEPPSPKGRSRTLGDFYKTSINKPLIKPSNPDTEEYTKRESKDDGVIKPSPHFITGLNSSNRSISLTNTNQVISTFPKRVSTKNYDFETEIGSIDQTDSDKQNITIFFDSLKEIKKNEDDHKLLDLFRKFNSISSKDTGRTLYFLRNKLISDKNISQQMRQVHLMRFYDVLNTWKKDNPKSLEVFEYMSGLEEPEDLSLQIISKFSDYTIPLLQTLIVKEMQLENTVDKVHYWSCVLERLQDHCLVSDIIQEKQIFIMSFNAMLTHLKKNENTKCLIEQFASDVKKNMSSRIKHLFERRNLPTANVIERVTQFVFLQYRFLKEIPTFNLLLEGFAGNVLISIYDCISAPKHLEQQKIDQRLQQFCKCVAIEAIRMIDGCAPIITHFANGKDDAIFGLSSAIFEQTRKSEKQLLKMIQSCCESEAQFEKPESAFRGKTVSIELSNLFSAAFNKLFNEKLIKMLKEKLNNHKKPFNLCMNVMDIHDFEVDKHCSELDEASFNNVLMEMNDKQLKEELANIDLDSFPKLKGLPKPIVYDPKNYETYFDLPVAELSKELKAKLKRFDSSCNDKFLIGKLINFETPQPRLPFQIPIKELSKELQRELGEKVKGVDESTLVIDLPLEKLEKTKEKVITELKNNYIKFFEQLKSEVKKVKEKKALLQFLDGLERTELKIMLSKAKFSSLSPRFRTEYCEQVCKRNESDFSLFLTGFLDSFYEMKLCPESQRLLASIRKVMKDYFPKLEIPLIANTLLLRWIIPAIHNSREFERHGQKSIVITLTAILQQLSSEGDQSKQQPWSGVYQKVAKGYSDSHKKFIDVNSTAPRHSK